jgi:hypothetical protein
VTPRGLCFCCMFCYHFLLLLVEYKLSSFLIITNLLE